MFVTNSTFPIGIFDSGLGGLTAVSALSKILPNEDVIYFGDTGRVPYGNKSRNTIIQYAKQDATFLQSKGVKLIVAACGTVSSVAAHIGEDLDIPFLGVVEPTAHAALAATKNGKIGVIGTGATIASGSYEKEMKAKNPNIQVFGTPCQLFVQMVEEGLIDPADPLPEQICRRYLAPLTEQGIDTLILGCTHFPLLSPIIGNIMGPEVTLIDSGHAVALRVKEILTQTEQLNPQTRPGKSAFYVSDQPQGFAKIAGRFLGKEIDNITQITVGSI